MKKILIGMHELSIATDILSIVEESAKNAGAVSVESIELEIGQLSGIEMEALQFALGISVKNTIAEGTKIIINMIQGEAHCLDCGKDNKIDDLFSLCSGCGSFRMDITGGKDMRIKSITVNHDQGSGIEII